MTNLFGSIRRLVPRRRRRFWRYVSPQRRSVGLLLLAVVVSGLYAWWYFTNDTRIRAQAEQALGELTGLEFRIERASFSLFGGVELRGVSAHWPDSPGSQPLFRARAVSMRHRPWALFVNRRIEPEEIVCVEPVVTLEYDTLAERYRAQLLEFAGPEEGEQADMPPLPTVRVQGGTLRIAARGRAPREVPLNLLMEPAGEGVYRVHFIERPQGRERLIRGALTLDIANGEVRDPSGHVPLPNVMDLIETVPDPQYRRWLSQRVIDGEVVVRERTDVAKRIFEIQLSDVALRLRPAEGGVELRHVHGTLVFDPNGIELEDVSGIVPQAGDAPFELSGRYGGYEPHSPFELSLRLEAARMPDAASVSGRAANLLERLHRIYSPEGRVDVLARIARTADGRTRFAGEMRPRGMSIRFNRLPYRIHDVRGVVRFDEDRIDIEHVTGRRGGMDVVIDGYAGAGYQSVPYDMRVTAADVPLSEELREALYRPHQQAWAMLNPRGELDVHVHVKRMELVDREDAQVWIGLDGEASMAYERFPYRVDGLHGTVVVDNSDILVRRVTGWRGDGARVTARGELLRVGGPTESIDLTVRAEEAPLAEPLWRALPEAQAAKVRSLNLAGSAREVVGRFVRPPGGELDWSVEAKLAGVSLKPDALPYAMTDASGVAVIGPRRVRVESLEGVHKGTPVAVSGQVLVDREPVGLDLSVTAGKLPLDEELYAALPRGVQAVWRKLGPEGRADVELLLRQDMPEQEAMDYRLTVRPRGMGVRYEGFPYRFTGVTGSAVATPGRVEIKALHTDAGGMDATLSGTVFAGEGPPTAVLRLDAEKVPIDERLLASLPESLESLGGRFDEGGSASLKLDRLEIAGAAAVAEDANSPATQPTTRPAGRVRWLAKGTVAVDGAKMDLGVGVKQLTGRFTGTIGQDPTGLLIDGKTSAKRIAVGEREVTDLAATIRKPRDSRLIQLRELSGKGYGGRFAGRAEARLGDRLKYGVQMAVEQVKVEQLVGKTAGEDVKGLLAGNIRLIGEAGRPKQRKAVGKVVLTRGKLYRLPVMLGFLHVVYLTLPGDAAFTQGQVNYTLTGQKLRFDEIYLVGSALSVVGSGTMDLAGEKLDLTFMAGPPRKIPRISELDTLVELLLRELVEIRVTGTLKNPKMRTVPLRSLEDIARRLTNPGG